VKIAVIVIPEHRVDVDISLSLPTALDIGIINRHVRILGPDLVTRGILVEIEYRIDEGGIRVFAVNRSAEIACAVIGDGVINEDGVGEVHEYPAAVVALGLVVDDYVVLDPGTGAVDIETAAVCLGLRLPVDDIAGYDVVGE
jgi:hypothetical protein